MVWNADYLPQELAEAFDEIYAQVAPGSGAIGRWTRSTLDWYSDLSVQAAQGMQATGQFEPAVLLGFHRQENLFLKNGLWDAGYVPLQIQREPFSLLPQRGSLTRRKDSIDVAVDINSPQIQADEGERVFLDDGEPSKNLQNIASMLAALAGGSTWITCPRSGRPRVLHISSQVPSP